MKEDDRMTNESPVKLASWIAEVVRCKVLPNKGQMDRAGLVEMIDVDPWTDGNWEGESMHRANFKGQQFLGSIP